MKGAYTICEVIVKKKALLWQSPSRSSVGSLLQIDNVFRNTQVSQNLTSYLFIPVLYWSGPPEARKAVTNQASNLLGVVPSHKEKEKT